jgi:hypothetical protein
MKFSIVTCSNNLEAYTRNVVVSLVESGSEPELLLVDNSDHRFSLPEALNHGSEKATGDVLVFCHQDVVFPPGWLDVVETQIRLIEARDPRWGVLGVMGVQASGRFAGHIHDPYRLARMGPLPCLVASLDEVCLLMRRDSGLHFDEELGGHHFYGADLCLAARWAGLKCYAIDAPLRHLSAGKKTAEFYRVAAKLKTKWSRIPRSPLAIETTCGAFPLRDTFSARLAVAYKTARRRARLRLRRLLRPNPVLPPASSPLRSS